MHYTRLKHLPRNIQEIHYPRLKRDRLEKERVDRVYRNISNKLVRFIEYRFMRNNIDENKLKELVEYLIEDRKEEREEDREFIVRTLYDNLRGNYPKLAEYVRRQI